MRLFDIDLKEKEIQSEIISLLRMKGFIVVRLNSGAKQDGKRFIPFYKICNTNSFAGLPDIVAFNKDRYLLIEVKSKSGKQRPSQRKFQELCQSKGIEYHIIHSEKELYQILEGKL